MWASAFVSTLQQSISGRCPQSLMQTWGPKHDFNHDTNASQGYLGQGIAPSRVVSHPVIPSSPYCSLVSTEPGMLGPKMTVVHAPTVKKQSAAVTTAETSLTHQYQSRLTTLLSNSRELPGPRLAQGSSGSGHPALIPSLKGVNTTASYTGLGKLRHQVKK